MKAGYKVGIVNTVTNAVESIHEEFKKQLPCVTTYDIIDTTMVAEIIEKIDPSPYLIARLAQYFQVCEQMGCDAILNGCSSISSAVLVAKQTVSIPVFQIDEPMANTAVRMGKRVGVVATAISTLKPSELAFLRARDGAGLQEDVQINMYYCEGAHKAYIMNGDKQTHDRIVTEVAKKAAEENDVIALAQGSMAALAPELEKFGVPVLTSISGGIGQVKDYLESLG